MNDGTEKQNKKMKRQYGFLEKEESTHEMNGQFNSIWNAISFLLKIFIKLQTFKQF